MRPGDYAWATLALGVVTYDVFCPRGELLSQAMDRYRQRNRFLTVLGVSYIALHLLRVWPRRADPLHVLSVRLGR